MLKLCRLMSAVLVGRWGSSDTILKGGNLRTIQLKFDPAWLCRFSGEDFLNIFPTGSYVKIMSADLAILVCG